MEIIVKLKDEVTEGFKKLSTNVKKGGEEMSGSFKLTGNSMASLQRVIVGGAAVAGAALVGFLVSSGKAAADAQVAMARVNATLKTMGDAALKNKDAILKAADAVTRLGFDDEDAAESITKMYQRTGNLTKAIQLNNLAMDLARAKNIDLLDAANLVGQVLSGNGRVLKQYGIEISDSLPPLEALKVLQKQVAGQAAEFSGTFQGQMEILSVNFQNIKEVIGSALIDALMPFIQQFTTWLNDPKTKEQFAYWTAEFKSWADVIIPTVIDVFKMWGDGLVVFYSRLVDIGNAIERIVTLAAKVGDSWSNIGPNIKYAMGLEPNQTLSEKWFGKRAAGGPVSGGSPYMVGERGPELFVPGTSGSIVPNGKLGGGISVVLNGNFYGTDQSAAEKFADMLAEMIGQNMKLRTI